VPHPLVGSHWALAVGHDITLNYFFSHTRADSILAGCALALFKNPALDVNGWRPSIWQFGLGIALILGAALVRNPIFAEVFRYTVQGVGLYIVFAFILTPNRITSPLLLMPWLRWIGRVSYSVYLFQIIAIKLAERFLPNHNFIVIAIVAAGLTLTYAWIMNVRVEKPLYKFRKSRETTNEGSLVTAELAGDHPLR
jgi:peptidoglycan/LPS O-acetylase OafA/YrhL